MIRYAQAILVVVVGVLPLGVLAQPRAPDARPAPSLFVRNQIWLDAYDYRRIDGSLVNRRRVEQRLDVFTRHLGIESQLGLSFAFDEGLASRPSHALLRQRQLEPTLHAAWVRWDLGAVGDATAGRHDLIGPLGFVRLDGLTIALRLDRWTVSASAGLRPDDALLRVDSDAYLPDTDREVRNTFEDHTVLTQAHVAFDDTDGGLGIGVRNETTVDGTYRDGVTVGLNGRVGALTGPHAVGHVRAHPATQHVERADVRATAPVRDNLRLSLQVRRAAPRFPADNLFSVFPITRYGEESLGGAIDHGRSRWTASVFHRRSGSADGDDGVHTGGGRLGWRGWDPTRTWTGEWSGSAAAGPRGDTFRAAAGVRHTTRRGPDWQLRQVIGTQRVVPARLRGSDRDPSVFADALYDRSWFARRTGAFTTATMHATAGGWADLRVDATFGWDTRSLGSLRVMAMADINLPGARP